MSSTINDAMIIKLDYELPEYPAFEAGIRRAPRRESHLSEADKALAIKNALRYIHPDHHEQMAKEFAQELEEHGRIYGYRFRPAGKLYGKPIEEYKGNCTEAKAFQVMIDNNLDFDVSHQEDSRSLASLLSFLRYVSQSLQVLFQHHIHNHACRL